MHTMTKLTWLRLQENQLTGTVPQLRPVGETFSHLCDVCKSISPIIMVATLYSINLTIAFAADTNNFDNTVLAASAGCVV